ncbi:MAG: hypothetical protein AABM40_05760 [Chloroflexota bacterium]
MAIAVNEMRSVQVSNSRRTTAATATYDGGPTQSRLIVLSDGRVGVLVGRGRVEIRPVADRASGDYSHLAELLED